MEICFHCMKKVTRREYRENGKMCDECRSYLADRYGMDMHASE